VLAELLDAPFADLVFRGDEKLGSCRQSSRNGDVRRKCSVMWYTAFG
jgi:hypothetical protein